MQPIVCLLVVRSDVVVQTVRVARTIRLPQALPPRPCLAPPPSLTTGGSGLMRIVDGPLSVRVRVTEHVPHIGRYNNQSRVKVIWRLQENKRLII